MVEESGANPSIRQGERKSRKGIGGPKTAAGKARVRRNPIKHGVLAQTPVIPLVEREEDWERLRQGVFVRFEVEGAMEEAMADRIAGLIWRLARVQRFETESIDRYLREVPRDWRASRLRNGLDAEKEVDAEDVRQMDRMLMARLLPGAETAEKIMRYETRLHRFLLQTVHQLLLLKGMKTMGTGRYYGVADLRSAGGLAQTKAAEPDSRSRFCRGMIELTSPAGVVGERVVWRLASVGGQSLRSGRTECQRREASPRGR